MSQQQSRRPSENGNGLDDKQGSQAPANQLEIYDTVVNPETSDRIAANLGTGFYTEDEQWQQVSSYLKGMYGDAAFGRRLFERAISETVFELGQRGWEWYDDDAERAKDRDGADLERKDERASPRTYIRERGEKIWEVIPETEQLEAMREFAGVTGDWMPPQWRMMETRHEASKSRDARTQDNLFGTRSHRKEEVDSNRRPRQLRPWRRGGGEQR